MFSLHDHVFCRFCRCSVLARPLWISLSSHVTLSSGNADLPLIILTILIALLALWHLHHHNIYHTRLHVHGILLVKLQFFVAAFRVALFIRWRHGRESGIWSMTSGGASTSAIDALCARLRLRSELESSQTLDRRRCKSEPARLSLNHHHRPLPSAVMSRAEQIRGKLFGNAPDGKANGADEGIPRSGSDNPLTIKIPQPAQPTPTTPAQRPKLRESKADSSPKNAAEEGLAKSFRERLVEQLGPDYHGAERYRLVQDDNKEMHWKRWGPYVSDRQWVSPASLDLHICVQCSRDEYMRVPLARFPIFVPPGIICSPVYLRLQSERTIPTTATPGRISRMITLDPAPTGGAKMVLEASPTTISVSALLCRFGTARIPSSRSGFSVSQVIKVIMEKT